MKKLKYVFSICLLTLACLAVNAQMKVGKNPTTINTGTTNFQVEGTTTTNQFVILKNGNVGIHTTQPVHKLGVVGLSGPFGGARTDGIFSISDGTGIDGDTYMQMGVVTDAYGWLQTGDPGVSVRPLIINPTGGLVGVGLTSPLERLHVQGAIRSSNASVGLTSGPGITLDYFGTRGRIQVTDGAALGNGNVSILATRVGIGGDDTAPNASAVLDLRATDKALLLPRVANTAAIIAPVDGMIIYDISSNCVRAYANGNWTECIGVQISAALNQIGNEGDSPDVVNSVVTAAQLASIPGVVGVVPANEVAYQDYIDANPALFSSPATVAEVNSMIATTNSAGALAQIGAEGDSPDAVNSVVTVAQINAILPAITGAILGNQTAYQDYIDANPALFGAPATQAQVQAMINAVNTSAGALEQIGAEGDSPDAVNSVVTVAQINTISPAITGAILGNQTAYQDYIDANPALFDAPATQAQVQAMINAVNTSAVVLAQIGAEGDSPDAVNSVVTVAQINTISPAITGAILGNQTFYQDYIDANPALFGAPATQAQVQAMINAVNAVGTIATINCGAPINNGTLTGGVAASGVSSVVSYTGGNGGTYSLQTVTSTGVTGLTATLPAGAFAVGGGNLTFTITGTTSVPGGTATFAFTIGGQTCNFTRTVATGAGTIATINCATPTNNGTLVNGRAASGVSSVVSYTGGNGGTYSLQTVTSTGVTGLTATLPAGTFAVGGGNLTFNITGTPTTSGTATFAFTIGGQTCNFTRTVVVGSIATLNCESLSAGRRNSDLIANVAAASGATNTLSYTGGNGGSHIGQTVTSTGVTGLTATLPAGLFTTSAGDLVYTITGTPNSVGTASFAVNIGGQTCTLTRNVDLCGAKISATQHRAFSCHNLGANPALDPHVPTMGINGAYIRYGLRGPNTTGNAVVDWQTAPTSDALGFLAAPTASTTDDDANAFGGTTTPPQELNAWGRLFGGSLYGYPKRATDPCPVGYGVASFSDFQNLSANNTVTRTGTFVGGPTNYGSAIHLGPNATTKILTFPAAGFSSGQLSLGRGSRGGYHAANEGGGSHYAWLFTLTDAFLTDVQFGRVYQVRCVRE